MKTRKVIVVNDLGYGDSGKGTVVDYLTDKYDAKLVVRYNGGPQAAHNVYVDGKHFCFRQMSSGSLAGADTFLMGEMIVNPMLLLREMEEFQEKFGFLPKIYISDRQLVNTTFHACSNRLTESQNNHGSCGLGVYDSMRRPVMIDRIKTYIDKDDFEEFEKLFIDLINYLKIDFGVSNENPNGDFDSYPDCEEKLLLTDDDYISEEIESLYEVYKEFFNHPNIKIISFFNESVEYTKILFHTYETIIFEGAQGTLLSPAIDGVHCTAMNIHVYVPLSLYNSSYCGTTESIPEVIVYGVTRSYQTRHGNGPLKNEVPDIVLDGEDNIFNKFQKNFRVGKFDPNSIRKAINFVKSNTTIVNTFPNINFKLFVTCLDNDPFLKDNHLDYVRKQRALEIADLVDLPLGGISFGKDRKDKQLVEVNKKECNFLEDASFVKTEIIKFL